MPPPLTLGSLSRNPGSLTGAQLFGNLRTTTPYSLANNNRATIPGGEQKVPLNMGYTGPPHGPGDMNAYNPDGTPYTSAPGDWGGFNDPNTPGASMPWRAGPGDQRTTTPSQNTAASTFDANAAPPPGGTNWWQGSTYANSGTNFNAPGFQPGVVRSGKAADGSVINPDYNNSGGFTANKNYDTGTNQAIDWITGGVGANAANMTPQQIQQMFQGTQLRDGTFSGPTPKDTIYTDPAAYIGAYGQQGYKGSNANSASTGNQQQLFDTMSDSNLSEAQRGAARSSLLASLGFAGDNADSGSAANTALAQFMAGHSMSAGYQTPNNAAGDNAMQQALLAGSGFEGMPQAQAQAIAKAQQDKANHTGAWANSPGAGQSGDQTGTSANPAPGTTPGTSAGTGGVANGGNNLGSSTAPNTFTEAPGNYTGGMSLANYFDPSYDFREQQGEKALGNTYGAAGNFLSGTALKGISDYGQNAASQEYANANQRYMADKGFNYNVDNNDRNFGYQAANNDRNFAYQQGVDNRNFGYMAANNDRNFGYQQDLNNQQIPWQQNMTLANMGLGATQSSNALQAALAQALANNQLTAGQTDANSTIGQGNNISGAIGQALQQYLTSQYLNQIQPQNMTRTS